MRDDKFLKQKLENIWKSLFDDVPKLNSVIIKFKGKGKYKFGHIKEIGKNTEIAINSLFKHEVVPEYVIDLIIAHELIHYMHGFSSPLKRKYRYPHKGGIVTKELKKRGYGEILKEKKKFFKNEWSKIYEQIVNFKN